MMPDWEERWLEWMDKSPLRAGVGMVGMGFLFFLCVGVFVSSVAFPLSFVHEPVERAEYTGSVVRVDYESGLLYQTTTVYLKTHPRSSAMESFCVLDAPQNPLTDRLRRAAETQEQVTLTASAPFFKPPWDCSTMPIVTGVKP